MEKFISTKHDFETRDPFIFKHNDIYYHCFTSDTLSVSVSCSDTLDGLRKAVGKVVFRPDDSMCLKELWAPELHIINGKCYIYLACDDGNNHNHRMYVLENDSSDPMMSYRMAGKISEPSDKWAIDGTVFNIRGKNYFIWSGWAGNENVSQELYIAEMKSPFELIGERRLISEPEYEYEKLGATGEPESPFINEGPFGMCYEGEYYLFYSAAGSWCTDYCITCLKLTGDDPLDRKSWKKLTRPILSSNDVIKGAGHASVFSENGKNEIFFHAWDKDERDIRWDTVSVWRGELKVCGEDITVE